MNFDLSDEQRMLRDSALHYLDESFDPAARRRLRAEGDVGASHWRAFAQMGWLAAPFPETAGGLGGGAQAVMVLMEAFGRHRVPSAYLWTVVVGGHLVLHGAAPERRAAWLDALMGGTMQWAVAVPEAAHAGAGSGEHARAERHAGGHRLSGAAALVPHGAQADRIVVGARTAGGPGERAGLTLFAVDRHAPGVTLQPFRTHDGHPAARLLLADVAVGPADAIGAPDHGLALLEAALDHGIAAACAEAIGAADHLIGATSEHVRTRQQYGAPLATLQVVQHRLADMLVAAEMARSMSCVATLSLDAPPPERARSASAARAYVLPAVRGIAQAAVQLHGGMGMSEDHDIGHHLKRLLCLEALFGAEDAHLDRYRALAPAPAVPAALPPGVLPGA